MVWLSLFGAKLSLEEDIMKNCEFLLHLAGSVVND